MLSRIYRILGAILIVYLAVCAVIYLQALFDRGDVRRASQFLTDFKPSGDKNLLTLMAADLHVPEEQVACESGVVSRTEGRVLIRCHGLQTADARTYEWMIHLVSYRVVPNNVAAQALLNAHTQEKK